MQDDTEDQDDFGATRAGDYGATSALPNSRPAPARPYSSLGIREQTAKYARVPAPDASVTPRTPNTQVPQAGPSTPAPAPVTTHYCGTCGAPLEPGRPFCGQCGSPVNVSGSQTPLTSAPSSSGIYRGSQPGANMGASTGANMGSNVNWGSAGWDEPDGDAPTVAELPMDNSYGGYAGHGAYAARGGYAGQSGYAQGEDSSRTLRLLVGILCLVGSFATAVAAIVLALATFH